MPPNVVLASNTSSISITRIAAQTERPHRVVSTLMLCFLLAQGGHECLAMACCAEAGALLSSIQAGLHLWWQPDMLHSLHPDR